jgi:hypothetical protein
MKLVTSEQMRQVDREAIDKRNIRPVLARTCHYCPRCNIGGGILRQGE